MAAKTFEALQLPPELVKACKRQGFTGPTPIQALVIPAVAKGKDVVVEAKTGSGKTLAYGLPLLARTPLETPQLEVLVVAPTRELAEQISAELAKVGAYLDRSVVTLTGGGGMDGQKAKLDAGAQFAVGTMGRIEELIERRILKLDGIRTVVLDEVDELLRGGFSANLAGLLGRMPVERQTMLFSATIPSEVESVARRFTRQPERIKVTAARETPAELKHQVLFTNVEKRLSDLTAYLRRERPFQTLVFCGTRNETEQVFETLKTDGHEVAYLHGELSPNKRRQLLETFRSGDLPVLVASDLVARGLDLPGVDCVVNYSLPQGTAAYLHRAGRTGRAGRAGVVLSLVIEQQHDQFEKLKPSFSFEGVGVVGPRSKVVTRKLKTREERDLEFRQLPPVEERRPAPRAQEQERPPKRGERPFQKKQDETKAAPRPGRDERKPARDAFGRDLRGPKSGPGASRKPEGGYAKKPAGPAKKAAPATKPAGGYGKKPAGAAPSKKPAGHPGPSQKPAGRPPKRGR